MLDMLKPKVEKPYTYNFCKWEIQLLMEDDICVEDVVLLGILRLHLFLMKELMVKCCFVFYLNLHNILDVCLCVSGTAVDFCVIYGERIENFVHSYSI